MNAVHVKSRGVRFLGEQIGPSEVMLKQQIVAYLSCVRDVERAYLVKVANEESANNGVALCMAGGAEHAKDIVENVETIFHALFRNDETLDIYFLSEAQKREVGLIAEPFYKSDGIDHCMPN